MNLKDKIQLRVVCDADPDLSALIVELHVQSGTKNPYSIVFPKTDRAGHASLSRTDIVEQFEDTWESGLMDYNGNVDTANPIVTVHLLDLDRIRTNLALLRAWPLLKNEKKRWPSREARLQDILSSRNDLFCSQTMSLNLELNPAFWYELKKKDSNQQIQPIIGKPCLG
ncbi:MAG: hypothetical protein HY343_04825 [Lentisphaerae bacterium]|nr:hypothetical protein [Lentisphaerota bacterium]